MNDLAERGRKFEMSVLGIVVTVLLVMLGARDVAYTAVGAIVVSFTTGNALVSWSYAGKGGDKSVAARREDGVEDTP